LCLDLNLIGFIGSYWRGAQTEVVLLTPIDSNKSSRYCALVRRIKSENGRALPSTFLLFLCFRSRSRRLPPPPPHATPTHRHFRIGCSSGWRYSPRLPDRTVRFSFFWPNQHCFLAPRFRHATPGSLCLCRCVGFFGSPILGLRRSRSRAPLMDSLWLRSRNQCNPI